VDAGEVVFRPNLAGGMADESRGDDFASMPVPLSLISIRRTPPDSMETVI